MKLNIDNKRTLLLIVAVLIVGLLSTASQVQAAEVPIKEILQTHLGAKVNTGTGSNICTVPPNTNCKPAEPSTQPGGFEFPEAIATGDNEIYVADSLNHRVQEFEADGTFIRMFGEQVNKTAHTNHETANENVCPVKPTDECEAGTAGGKPGQLNSILGIAVNHANNAVYVAETITIGGEYGARVQEFTPEGRFVLEIGEEVNTKEVNANSKKNLCTQEEIEIGDTSCTAPKLGSYGESGIEHEPFISDQIDIALGGPEELLYVGDEHRIDEFTTKGKTDGEPAIGGQLSLSRIAGMPGNRVKALAIQPTGDIFFTYQTNGLPDVIYKVAPNGEEVAPFPITLSPRVHNTGQFSSTTIYITALAVNQEGNLGATEAETQDRVGSSAVLFFGSLLSPETAHLITEFTVTGEFDPLGVAFDSNNELFVVTESNEVLGYKPEPVGALLASPPDCVFGAERETSDTFVCELNGTVNPDNVANTEVWFEWGSTCAFGNITTKQPISVGSSPIAVESTIVSQKPNETLCYRLVGEDLPVKAPELLASESNLSSTPIAPPKIIGEPSIIADAPFSAVMFSEINPENTNTTYHFEYGPCEAGACAESPYPNSTSAHESSQYGTIGTVLEAVGLQPNILYHYRLKATNTAKMAAVNDKNEADIPEGQFLTSPAPKVEVGTDNYSNVTANSASIYGTVNPDGQAAAYQFELGVYRGAATEFGVVFSGSAGVGNVSVLEGLVLTGLQPGTQYAFRITAHSGDGSTQGSSATGSIVIFTTIGESEAITVPSVLPLLPIPGIEFPSPSKAAKPLTEAQKLTSALKSCKKKPRKRRPACERNARKRYPIRPPQKK
jgi:hypothetical protein